MILVTGGARSGKSRHAESLLAQASSVRYIATSQIFDEEMAERIRHHQDGRPAHWHTIERWQGLEQVITADMPVGEAVLLECVTTLVTNLMFAFGGETDPQTWDYPRD